MPSFFVFDKTTIKVDIIYKNCFKVVCRLQVEYDRRDQVESDIDFTERIDLSLKEHFPWLPKEDWKKIYMFVESDTPSFQGVYFTSALIDTIYLATYGEFTLFARCEEAVQYLIQWSKQNPVSALIEIMFPFVSIGATPTIRDSFEKNTAFGMDNMYKQLYEVPIVCIKNICNKSQSNGFDLIFDGNVLTYHAIEPKGTRTFRIDMGSDCYQDVFYDKMIMLRSRYYRQGLRLNVDICKKNKHQLVITLVNYSYLKVDLDSSKFLQFIPPIKLQKELLQDYTSFMTRRFSHYINANQITKIDMNICYYHQDLSLRQLQPKKRK